jgi:3-mercaptopyruvate sulfurtransferase SseA
LLIGEDERVPQDEGYVEANGVRMFYERQGSGEPLLLLHAAAAANPSWSAQLDTLAERYEVILAERRGHGRTADVEGPITYQLMAADMTAFMEGLGITSAHLVGWSDGSDVAMVMGAQARAQAAGVSPEQEVVTDCQGGVRAAHTALALTLAGYPTVRVYDGSWAEWDNDPGSPIETTVATVVASA